MDHLFFDIECANCDEGKGKICSFGYVLCDSELKIKESRDFIINPDAPFHLTNRRDKRDVILSYSEEEFLSAPKFPEFSDEIFSLLTRENTLVWGYAVVNDVNFLLSECERYRLKMPDFIYFDVQLLYADFLSVKNVMSLERAVQESGVQVGEEHNSREDAENTMIVAKKVCNSLGLKLETVIPLSPRVKGEIKGGVRQQMSEYPKKKAYEYVKDKIRALPVEFGNLKEEEAQKNRDNAFKVYDAKRKILHNFDSGVKSSSTIGELIGKINLGE